MNKFSITTLKALRKLYSSLFRVKNDLITEEYCQFKNQAANDLIYNELCATKSGFMLSKWGTIELNQAINTYLLLNGYTRNDYLDMIKGKISIPTQAPNFMLFNNAGVFPLEYETANRFGEKALKDCCQIDILGSYVYNERKLFSLMKNAKRVNLDAFYAPWLFNNPWTKWLEGKKVLVVHPFSDSIQYQYDNNREKLFSNPEVLPKFKSLQCIKAIQSQAGEKTPFADWFEALHYMEKQIDKCDYEVAIIGCGAYGMSLASHVKKQKKVALHLAGWTQMLFGVYGERWVSQQSQYGNVINEYWIRPNLSEGIKNASSVENGCYW